MSIPKLPNSSYDTHDTARLAFMLKLVDTLHSMPDASAIEDVACRMLAENLPVEFAWFAEIGPGRRQITIRSEFTRDRSVRLAGIYPIECLQSLVRIIEAEQPYIIDDAFQSFNIESPERSFYEDHRIRSCLAFPVAKGKQALTCIAIADDIPRHWTAREVSLVHETAVRVGDAIGLAGDGGLRRLKPADKYRAILDSIDDAFAFCELVRDEQGKAFDFRYLEFNASFGKRRGMNTENIVGRLASEVNPDPEPWWLHTFVKVVDTNQPVRTERFFDERWYDVGVYPFGGGNFSVIFRDITQRRLDEEHLRKSEQRLSLALTSAKMGAFEWNSEGHHLTLSEFSKEVFGLMPGEEFPTSDVYSNLIHSDDRERHRQVFERASTCGEDYQCIYRIIRPVDGRTAWIEECGCGYKDDRTGTTSIVGVHWDVTQRVIAEEQTKNLLRLREEFIANASHELKTPLTSITAYGQLLQKQFEEVQDERSNLMQKLNSQVSRLHKLVRDLLDTTRLAEGRMVLTMCPLDLNALIRERIEELQRITDKHSLVLLLRPIPEITADRERIAQVIANIVSNAIKYSPEPGEIVISSITTSEGVRISVRDHGVGIPIEAVDKIFDRFFRVASPHVQAYPGMGLGLYISSQIVRLHGGRMDVKSTLGEGSEFSFLLPA